ncbi:MAG: ATP-binding protein [Acetatifactor sp.]|nr:ATP-binding protein [Acetatifactor sp.]
MIPFDFLDKTAKDFDWNIYGDHNADVETGRELANAFVLNFHKWRQKGKGLYIYSSTKGTGKTYLSFCPANEVMNRYGVNVKFISVLDYLDLTKKSYNSMTDKEEKDSITKATVLILDDIGVEINREWINTTLYQMINYRYLNKLITIITSNYPVEQLKADDRFKSRIDEMCLPLHIPEISVRAMKTDKENREFIHEILKQKTP